ncbi:hypothetical protein [Microvirga alba]|uniref:Uncharacterized protein n=1 Tax=Microvirga alba TaxID=2791025 RepID=A0A931BM01_9HYPH|nr:hypothetical protein [Microvirga alba]MBF9232333.1 hypothetical protein [Microvirga alba]
MTPPVIPLSVWLLGAFDPILVVVAVLLGWKADQIGKVFIAAIAALGISVLVSWGITGLGLPWIAPISHDTPTLYPVRAIAALVWAGGAYAARRVWRR